MSKQEVEIVSMIGTYLREAAGMPEDKRPKPIEIEYHITKLLVDTNLVDRIFTIEVIPINNNYMLRPRNVYTSMLMGALPMFCSECGKLMEPIRYKGMAENKIGYMPCPHGFTEQSN
jgi:hypothetical protein